MQGFSVVELLVNASIVMTLSAVSLPVVTSSLDTYRLRHDARRLNAECQNARYLAISSNVSHRVHWTGAAIELQKRTAGSYVPVESLPLSPGISVATAWSADPVFSPRGTVSPPATMILRNRRGMTRTVSISIVGRVSEQ